MQLEELLDRTEALREARDFRTPGGFDARPGDATTAALLVLLEDRSLRPEHRDRIYEDLAKNRALLLRLRDPRLLDLIHWGEQVERLHASLRKGRLSIFHFTRAMEATARRCRCELLPVMGRLDQLSHAWANRDYETTLRLLLPDLVEAEAPGEAPTELRSQA